MTQQELTGNSISFVVPSYNNLKHLKNVYASIKKHAPQSEIILLDDGSNDGTFDWMSSLQDKMVVACRCNERMGHTILYDKGIKLASNDVVGILHADMILGPGYVENMLKHLKPGTVVCATRIEPPLHPEGKEKIIKDFGMDFDTLNIDMFEEYVTIAAEHEKDKVTKGMFAPWILYKEDFKAIGGHDPLFAPFPYEDSDIFQRWILAGYELIQSRDAFVYHLTCRGHRWNEQVGVDDDYYKKASSKAARNYLRKWGSWIRNDEYQYPIIPHKYNIAFVIKNANSQLVEVLEPWCDRLYLEDDMQVITDSYIEKEQQNTTYNLKKRVLNLSSNYPEGENDIVVIFDGRRFTNESYKIIQSLPDIIAESGEVGTFELDCFEIIINNMTTYEKDLVICSTSY